MLDTLSQGFQKAKDVFSGKKTLNEENIAEATQLVRRSLLEADVEYGISKEFVENVKNKALGESIETKAGSGQDRLKVSPGDHFVKICKEELQALLGPENEPFAFAKSKPTKIMMVGLQGTGKTTTSGKLAALLRKKYKKKPLLVAADTYRPAAVDQLKTLGKTLQIPVFHVDKNPVDICREAEAKAAELGCDVILMDTAGRLTIDDSMMQELTKIQELTKPDHVLLVCDAMTGQDAVTTAQNFHTRLSLNGFVMTKLDGDARGGAALSIRRVTSTPIRFIGTGEGLDQIEEFRGEGLASRILGLGDIVGLMENFEQVATEDAEEKALQMLEGKFTLQDFLEQLKMIQNMGPIKDLLAKLPKNMLPPGAQIDEKQFQRIQAMISSMTPLERKRPSILDDSRKRRIAKGSGHKIQDVNALLKQYQQLRKMMDNTGRHLSGMFGGMPGMKGLSKGGILRKALGSNADMDPDMAASMMNAGMPGMMPPGATYRPKPIDHEKIRKDRKKQRKNRKQNRKR
ncbi:MAG: signal recognition particle protein [Oligoflexales bacterium]